MTNDQICGAHRAVSYEHVLHAPRVAPARAIGARVHARILERVQEQVRRGGLHAAQHRHARREDPFAADAPAEAAQQRQQRGGMSGMDLSAIVQEADITTEEAADAGDWATAWEVEQDLRGKADEHAALAKQKQEEEAEQLRVFAEEKATRLAKAKATNRLVGPADELATL